MRLQLQTFCGHIAFRSPVPFVVRDGDRVKVIIERVAGTIRETVIDIGGPVVFDSLTFVDWAHYREEDSFK